MAAKAGHEEAVRALLEVSATKVNWQNHKGDLIGAFAPSASRALILGLLS